MQIKKEKERTKKELKKLNSLQCYCSTHTHTTMADNSSSSKNNSNANSFTSNTGYTKEDAIEDGLETAAATLIAPALRVLTIYQVDPSKRMSFSNMWATGRKIAQTEGTRALWRGNAAYAASKIPFAATSFTVYQGCNHLFLENALYQKNQWLGLGPSLFTALVVTHPFEVLQTRMSVSPTVTYRQLLSTLSMRQLFGGLSPRLLSIALPGSGVFYLGLEQSKYNSMTEMEKQNYAFTKAAKTFAGLAVTTAGVGLFMPLQIINLRRQVNHPSVQNLSIVGALHSIAKTEGISRGLFKGTVATIIGYLLISTFSSKFQPFFTNE